MRWKVRRELRRVKNDWFQMKANEAESSKNNGKIVWQCIQDLQRGRNGMLPLRTYNNEDEREMFVNLVELVLE